MYMCNTILMPRLWSGPTQIRGEQRRPESDPNGILSFLTDNYRKDIVGVRKYTFFHMGLKFRHFC